MSLLTIDAIEMLIGADITDVEKADKDVQKIRDRINETPATQTVKAPEKAAIASMERVEQAAKKLVSKDTALKLDADIARAEKNLATTNRTLEGLQVKALGGLDVTAETRRAENAIARTEKQLAALTRAKALIEVEADPTIALAGLAKVERSGKQLVSQTIALRVNAEIGRATSNIAKLEEDLAILRLKPTDVRVEADIRRTTANLDRARAELKALDGARAEMVVDVNEGAARKKLSSVADFAGETGEKAGASFAKRLDGATRGAGEKVGEIVGGDIEGTLTAALVGIPVAGGIVLAAVGIGKAIVGGVQDGLGQEAGQDRLQGLTGIDEAAARRLAGQAAQAYTEGFGESIEKNMDTTRLGLQYSLIDPETSNRDAKAVIEGLEGIADALGEDVEPTARAVTQLLRTGLARSAQEAFDLLAKGQQRGLNIAGDLLDTVDEYSTQFRRLGIDGPEAFGLLSQAVRAGARDSDVAADALKEFVLFATDPAMKKNFDEVGFSWDELNRRISAGGPDAAAALDETLDKLRAIEDPAKRDAAAVALFGTKAEDLGAALYAMDLTTAVDEFGQVEGAAKRMFDTLASNDASKIQQAQRNVEVAMDGIKGALAAGFAEPLAETADWVSQNRGPILDFFGDLVIGALDFSSTLAHGTADGAEAIGELVSGPLASLVIAFATVKGLIPGQSDEAAGLKQLGEEMRGFRDTTSEAADRLRLGADRIDSFRDRASGIIDAAAAVGYVNDASLRLADAMGMVGSNVDVAKLSLEGYDAASLRSSESGRLLEEQLRGAIAALAEQVTAAQNAGESQDAVTARYEAGREALVGQMAQMGLSREAAQALIDTILQTPPDKSTTYNSNADEQAGKVRGLNDQIRIVNGKTVVMDANIAPAVQELTTLQRLIGATVAQQNSVGPLKGGYVYAQPQALGGVMEFMASGGLRGSGLTPMASIAQMVPASTWRVVGDRSDVAEAYIPLDNSARSKAIQAEVNRRMPVDEGGVAVVQTAASPVNVQVVNKTGVNLMDLIDMRIETAQGWRAVNFDNGTAR